MFQISAYRSNYSSRQSPRLIWLSEGELEEIHSATIEVLERVGVRVDHEQSLKLLKEAGCIVRDSLVKIPGWLVEEAIQTAPSRINIFNRDGNHVMRLGSNRAYFGPGSDLPFHLDLETGERRRTVFQDIVNAARIVDKLPNFDFVMSNGIPGDLPAATGDLNQFAAMLVNCSKPIIFTSFNARNTQSILEMAAASRGSMENLRDKPFLILYTEPISPLVHTRDGIEKMFACIEQDIPVIYTPGVVAGGTCPVTKAGTIVQMNAESLSGLLIAQLRKKGAPVIIGGGATPMDMKTTATLYGSPDAAMNYCTMTELAKYYRLPNFTEGGCCNSPLPDAQAGMEASISLLLNQLSGANLVHDVGYLDGGKTGSLPFLVMCEDFISASRYIGAGTVVNEETMAVEAIAETGPAGHYLASDHTMKYFRSEIWMPEIFNRLMWDNWKLAGARDCFALARDKALSILKEEPLNKPGEKLTGEIERILSDSIIQPGGRQTSG